MSENLDDFDLPNEERDEEIILLAQKHHFTLFIPFLKICGIAVLSILIYSFFGFSPFTKIIFFITLTIVVYIISKAIFVFKNDIYILTNKRIIDIDQKNFFSRSVTETNLDKIQNTKYEIKGMIQTLLNFGNVVVKTAGSKEGIILEQISNPYELQQKIIQAQKNAVPVSKPETAEINPPHKKKEIVMR